MSGHSLDPITTEVISNRLLAIVNDQQAALIRTAFSTVVRESEDLACGVFDSRGQMIAQSLTGTPGHINAMATGVRHFTTAIPAAELRPGDVLLTNDPWQTTGQVNDFTVVTPVFVGERVIGYFANTCHAPDIGGRVLSGAANDVFEEGLRIPIMRLYSGGVPNEELLGIIRANVRTPDETVGDLFAQTACNEVGARQLRELCADMGLDSIDEVGEEIISRSELAIRNAIRELPNGVYANEGWSDGFGEEPVLIAASVSVEDESIHVDFAGSSPESRFGINVVLNYTEAYASFALKAALAPEVPHNAGSFRPVHVTAPEGSILNCRAPAAVGSRHLLGHFLPGIIIGALAPVLPERVLAGGADALWMLVWMGSLPEREKFSLTLFQAGGMGARATKDGLNATGFPSGVAGVPAEVIESLTPLVQRRRELRRDSGGPGRFRGGCGQESEMVCRSGLPWSLSAIVDRTGFAAPGILGGGEGALGELRNAAGEPIATKRLVQLEPDATVRVFPPGGGGYGDPFARPPAAVLADVVEGYVSIESARSDYGVAVSYLGRPDALVRLPSDYELDDAETARLRGAGRLA